MKPRAAIRRFDVFAEYNKLESLQKGYPVDEAKGYGLWVAKVVASRRGRPSLSPQAPHGGEHATESHDATATAPRFHELAGEPQTDRTFDREVVARMGEDFYREVFAPAIKERFDRGDRYESFRDAIRRGWKP